MSVINYCDIIGFDPSTLKADAKFYGYDRLFVLGKDVYLYPASREVLKSSFVCAGTSILSSSDTDVLVRFAKRFDFLYSTVYDASPALMTKAAASKRKLIVNIDDILSKEGTDRAAAMHRISRFLKFCLSYRAEFIIASFAKTELDLRSVQESSDIFRLMGLTEEKARYSLSSLSNVIKQGQAEL